MQAPMRDANVVLLMLAVVGGSIAFSAWRYRMARDIAEEWLMRHRYRVRSLLMAWFSFPRFAPRLLRSEKRSVEFRAEVDDLSLGGTGVVWMRVWTDWIGVSEREPDISWERMPRAVDDGSRTLEDKWAIRQRELLERVASGEHTFRPESRSSDDARAFDELVEHLTALARRGLVSCSAPVMDVRGVSQYAVITDVALTAAGQRWLDEARAR